MHHLKQASPPLKRRSSEPHHVRNKPSIVIEYDLRAATTPSNPRPISSRKTFFYVVLITLACTYLQHKLLGRHLPYQHIAVQTGTSILPTIVTATYRDHVQQPLTKQSLILQEPTYQITLLRSVLLHQNDTYRNAIPSKQGREWFVQSIAWLSVKVGGIRPDHKSIAAYCKRRNVLGDASKSGIRAVVNVVWTDPKDRGIGQDVMFIIECDAGPFLAGESESTRPSSAEALMPDTNGDFSVEKSKKFLDRDEVMDRLQGGLVLDFSFVLDLGLVETTSSGPVKLKFHFQSPNLTIQIDETKEHVTMAACLSPAFYDEMEEEGNEKGKKGNMPLLRWIEWREHMRHLGVKRVNWSGRHIKMKDFVDTYNELQGTKDTIRWAPPLHEQANPRSFPYHDQDAYLTDCILSNRDSSDYLLVLDYDEYPMINFDDEAMSPASQWLEFMKSLPDDRGSWEMTRIPMSSSIASSGGGLHELELVQNQMDCINGKDEKVKSFYRSKTVIAVNQHKKTRMYPIGEDIAKQINAKPDRHFWEQGWNSSIENAWPKLFHYRWFDDPAENICTSPPPLKSSPGYQRYLERLRRDVHDLKEQIEQILP